MKLFKRAGFIFGIIGIFTLSVLVVKSTHLKGNAQSINDVSVQPPLSGDPAVFATPTPVSNAVFVHSPDGTQQVIMHTQKQQDNSVLYTFATSAVPSPDSGASTGEKVFFNRTIGGQGTMAIPLNTYSPDNKLLFLEEDESGFKNIYVFKADGSFFANGQQYLDVSSLFAQKQTSNVFNTVTGWDSATLMHVSTTIDGKTRGTSYWFEVPSMSFIPLAS